MWVDFICMALYLNMVYYKIWFRSKIIYFHHKTNIDFLNSFRGTSSNGRALDSHSRGTGIDTPVLQWQLFWKKNWYRKEEKINWLNLPKTAKLVCTLNLERIYGILLCPFFIEKALSDVGFEPTPTFVDQNTPVWKSFTLESGALDRSANLTCHFKKYIKYLFEVNQDELKTAE